MTFSYKIHNFQEKAFDFILYLSYFLYFLFSIGFANNAPEYLIPLEYYTKVYIGLFLLLRFNPFRTVKFTELDKKIAFSAGVFIISVTILNKTLLNYITEVRSALQSIKIF